MTPIGNDVVVTESAGLIVMASACVAVRDPLSVTRTVMFDVPVVVGVPLIAPDDEFNDNPAGNVPAARSQVYGVVPPVAAKVVEGYVELTTPTGNDVVVIESAALTVIESACVAVRDPLSVTRTVKFEVAAVVGVPVIAPDDASKDKPAGKVPTVTAQLYGVVPPEATKVAE